MSGPIGRLIATVIIATAQLGTRVVVDAWRQAAAKGAQQAARGGQAAQEAAGKVTSSSGMPIAEARQILGVKENSGLKVISDKYTRMISQNDPEKGGSVYLQAKIYQAKLAIEENIGEKIPDPYLESMEAALKAAEAGETPNPSMGEAPKEDPARIASGDKDKAPTMKA